MHAVSPDEKFPSGNFCGCRGGARWLCIADHLAHKLTRTQVAREDRLWLRMLRPLCDAHDRAITGAEQ